MMEQALSDVKVLDLTWHIAGPMCTKYLADHGAEVLKIERPGDGDPARSMGPFFHDIPHPEKSGLFLYLNSNKRAVTLNLKTEFGKRIFKDLVKDVDIVVESFSPGVMAKFGLDYETLEQINPKLVMTSISNFGQTGPYRDYKSSELTINSMGGAMYTCGIPNREPLKRGGTCLQHQAGLIGAVATMGALWTREIQGFGQHVDVSIMETQAGSIDYSSLNTMSYIYTGVICLRDDPREAGLVILPAGVYPCKDGFTQWLTLPQWWSRYAELLDVNDFTERFPDIFDMTRKGELDALLMNWTMERTKREVMQEAQKARLGATACFTSEDVVKDPHYQERGFWVEIDHPMAGKVKFPGASFKMSITPWQIRSRASMLGEHNREVYCDQLGFTKEDLIKLGDTGVI